jgi:hypothetical protein
MPFRLIQKILELGMDLVKLINCKICVITLFIITVKLFYLGQKTLECGMLWEVVIKKWKKIIKLNDVIHVLKVQRIDKE